MDLKIELIPVPVTDIDRAKHFYADQVGFTVDFDHEPAPGLRLIQLTPPGSGCSIAIGSDVSRMEPGTLQGVQLVVDDIAAVRDRLLGAGVEAGPVQHYADGGMVDGPGGPWNSFVRFTDPDGNVWVLQERPAG